MIRNMRSTQNINICCGPAEPVPLTLRNGNEENHDHAVEEAGKAAGRLLKEVLINDKRTFATEKGYTRMYRWTGEEEN